jgi:hypothetical protein
MNPELLAELQILRLDLAQDIQLATNRDQHIRSITRLEHLDRVLESIQAVA